MAQVGEEPPFLTVGTEVSAKYRGAFCEASIKSVKKVVKCKVTFSKTNASSTVNDDCIKGTLKVGSTVEVKSQDGQSQEASIVKLTDASVYTVVFDDGDERTLRRTSLCLKGERHFNESETLDHLPLTDPENFGTPVMQDGKKRKKRSLSQAASMDDSETEKDDTEPPPSKKKIVFNDSIVGKAQVGEEPPFLTVGTEVSAKYRGAFCEASIKSVKKVVKCKVTFSKTNASSTVNDDCIKGTLKVGSTVEVKSQDEQSQEASIVKLTDASVYTVVFDDGDERTLRRTSLCLKGERHFNESEIMLRDCRRANHWVTHSVESKQRKQDTTVINKNMKTAHSLSNKKFHNDKKRTKTKKYKAHENRNAALKRIQSKTNKVPKGSKNDKGKKSKR